jgi:hypothetical protein
MVNSGRKNVVEAVDSAPGSVAEEWGLARRVWGSDRSVPDLDWSAEPGVDRLLPRREKTTPGLEATRRRPPLTLRPTEARIQ